ncbi:snRNA-activating protein complex subunit isoform X2 [Selaginella moellendorffii]|nr:snRNA-activating protein complex subunit isoform X2 [Selaginella moellendorffii]|eukprot:XP_024523354.1 snRNA-activating protein complex subunit isoform X2 [Selaginella moellendorffii]
MEMDEQIRVDDLKFLSPDDLINIAVENTSTREICLTNHASILAQSERRRRGARTGRPCDGLSRATLQTDPQVESMLHRLIEERNTAKANAAATLHSLRVTETQAQGDTRRFGRRLRTAGPLRFVTSLIEEPTSPLSLTEGNEIAPGGEVLISIDFHNGTNLKIQELVVLGRQSLCEFRDQLHCLTDELARKKRVASPSGYLLIEDVFYNDMRHPDAVDYSENIISWIAKQDDARQTRRSRSKLSKLPSFKKANMAETHFRDLNFKLGSKYLYCHQGDCKHVFVIRDMRLIHEDDARSPSTYPVLRFLPRLRYRKCSICSVYRARKIVRDDKLAPSNPCFFCDSCYYSLHYSSEGVLLYEDFSVEDCHHE